jgi:hypothetical protein
MQHNYVLSTRMLHTQKAEDDHYYMIAIAW